MTDKKPLELYVHIPFCVKKCNYCDFLSAAADDVMKDEYVSQLIREIRAQAQIYSDYYITSIFIGGGTPSILGGYAIANILSVIYEVWAVLVNAEITVECNPGTLDPEKLEIYKSAGVNRLSIGLQSADPIILNRLGRIHTYEDFLQSYQYARKAGFENINIDLMSGIPGLTTESWKNTLRQVCMLKPEHISAYSLIIEEGTPFYDIYMNPEGKKLLLSEEEDRKQYYLTGEILEKNGYERYEVSNYARPGYECKHNIGYWTGAEYLGLGLGSSSYVKEHRFHSERDIRKYLAVSTLSDLTPLYQEIEYIDKDERMEEFMILGLRMMKGVSGQDFTERFGLNMFHEFESAIRKNLANGLLQMSGSILRYTERGLDLANVVERDFICHNR